MIILRGGSHDGQVFARWDRPTIYMPVILRRLHMDGTMAAELNMPCERYERSWPRRHEPVIDTTGLGTGLVSINDVVVQSAEVYDLVV